MRIPALFVLFACHGLGADVARTAAIVKTGVAQVHARTMREGREELSVATGAVIDSTGLIVTKYLEPSAQAEVRLTDGTTASSKVLGTDEVFEIAYLQMRLSGKIAHLAAASRSPSLGESVIATGFLSTGRGVGKWAHATTWTAQSVSC